MFLFIHGIFIHEMSLKRLRNGFPGQFESIIFVVMVCRKSYVHPVDSSRSFIGELEINIPHFASERGEERLTGTFV